MPPIHGRRNRSGRPGGCRTNNSTRKNFYVHIRPLGQLSLASPPGSLNRVPSSDGNVTSAGWQVTLCDPMWHVSSLSSVATLRTAIYLLLTYYINFREREMNKNTSRKNAYIVVNWFLGKISKSDSTRCQILMLKCTKFDFRWGPAPNPARGTFSAPQPLVVFKGATSTRSDGVCHENVYR